MLVTETGVKFLTKASNRGVYSIQESRPSMEKIKCIIHDSCKTGRMNQCKSI